MRQNLNRFVFGLSFLVSFATQAGLSKQVLVRGKVYSFSGEFVNIHTEKGNACTVPKRYVLSNPPIENGKHVLIGTPPKHLKCQKSSS